MKRRLFVKQAGIVSIGILAFSGSKLQANTTEEVDTSVIDLLPISTASQKINLKGSILDAATQKPIDNCVMTIKTRNNRFFNTTKNLVTSNGSYTILSGFSEKGKASKKIEVEIKASGYKTYKSFVYLTPKGCNLHSNEWNYNPNFDHNQCPKNETMGNETFSTFNFQLVK